jgi:murein DD-endopeptidase MepM/ murein hydrolase activator NlpD
VRALAALGLAAAVLGPNIGSPIDGLRPADIHDSFNEMHNGHAHEAVDLMAPRGTPVRAVVNGSIRKLFQSKAGGTTIYEFDDAYERCYYYAHLDHYADGLHEEMRVKRGDVIAYVGSTGNADPRSPHLHFAITELGPRREWWNGRAINPYDEILDAVKSAK